MNNFAISSTGIGEALKRSAAALAAGGNTIDESIALITAANNVVQNPDAVGTAMKTYSMYLRAAKAEAEEAGESTDGMANSVSKLRDELLTLTGGRVDIMENDTTFKSTYQVTKELSQIWDTVSDIDRAAILEKIGGKRNANTLSGLITNFAEAEKVLETSLNSAGSAIQENEKYLDSIAGKTTQLKAAFEDLSTSFLSSDIFKGFIDGGTKVIEILDFIIDKIGGVATVITGIGIAKTISGVVPVIQRLGGVRETLSLLTSDIATSKLTSNALLMGIESKFSLAAAGIGAVAAVISTATTAIKNSNEAIAKRASEASDAAREYKQVADSIEEYKQKITEIREELNVPGISEDMAQGKRAELVEIEAQLVDVFGQEAAALDLINGSVSDQIALIDSLSGKSFDTFKNENVAAITRAKNIFSNLSGISGNESILNGEFKGFYSDGLLSLPSVKYYMDQVAETGVGIRVFQDAITKEFEKRFGTESTKIASAMLGSGEWKHNNTGGTDNFLFGVNDITQMRDYVETAMEAIRSVGKKTFGNGYEKYLSGTLSSYSDILGKINSIIDENEEIFNQYAEGTLATEYRERWSELLTKRKEYEEAVLSGDEATIESAYNAVESMKDAFGKDFSKVKDTAVQKYLTDYFENFKDQEIEVGAKIKIRDNLKDQQSDLNQSLNKSLNTFLDADGRIEKSFLAEGKLDFDNGQISDYAESYKELADAAEGYGLTVEQLVSILTDLGRVQDSLTNTAYGEASKNFADVTKSIKDAYTGIDFGNADSTAFVENDLTRLKNVFADLANTVDISSGEINQSFLDNMGNTVSLVADALGSFTAQAENVASANETINAAIAEQESVGSITAETYAKLMSLGSEYSNILEWNGRAIAVNSDAVDDMNSKLRAMTSLESEAVQEKSIEIWQRNAEIIGQMSNNYSKLSDSQKEALDSMISYNRELMASITGFQLLMSQMDFANSGYKKWLDAGSKTDTDKMYSDAVNAYQATQEVFGYTDKSSGKWVEGNKKINSIKFNAATAFLVPEEIREQGLPAVQTYLKGIQKYMQDDQSSVESFLKDAKAAGLMNEENGKWSVKEGVMSDQFRKELNITEDLFTSLVGDANVYGVEFKFDDENQILALNDAQDYFEAQNEYNKAVEKWNKAVQNNTTTDEATGKKVVKQTKEVLEAKKELEDAENKKNDKLGEMTDYSDATLKNIGVKFEDGVSREEAVQKWLNGGSGTKKQLEIEVALAAIRKKNGVEKLIQQYRESYADMLEDPGNLEAANNVQQIAAQLESLPKEVQVAFGIDTTLFDSGIASISETIEDLKAATNIYQLDVETGATEEELDGLKGKVDNIVTALNGLPTEKLIEIGFTGDVLNEDGKIDTDKLLTGLSSGTFSLDNLNLDVKIDNTEGIEGTLQTLEQIQGKINEIRGMGDLIVVADVFIDEAMAKIGDLKADFDSIKNLRAAPTVILSAPNVLFLIGEIKNMLAEISGSEHNATVTATVMQAALALSGIIGQIGSIEGDHPLSVTASTSQAVNAIYDVQNALDGLEDKTVTVTVNTVNTGGGGGSGVNGSAFAGGDWGVKRGGISLVGELGRKVLRLRTEMCVINTFI